MKRVLLTGMSAQQSSSNLAKKTVTFAGVVADILRLNGYDVDHVYPDINLTKSELEKYDRVIVGVSPILSLSSHRAYGALKILSELKGSEKLMYLVDSPEPEKIVISHRSMVRNIDDLFKPFYRGRADYATVSQDHSLRDAISQAALSLLDDWNRKTIYPMTPFVADNDVDALMFDDGRSVFRGVSIDKYLLSYDTFTLTLPMVRSNRWVTTSNKTKWYKTASNTVKHDIVPLRSSKKDTDNDVKDLISKSTGLLATPQNNGLLWWSYQIVQAINTGTLVVSDWRITQALGDSWRLLPAAVEETQTYEYIDLAKDQRDSYLGKIDNIQEMTSRLMNEVENTL